MNIVMYVPGMPFDGNTIAAGKSLGGSETSGYYLARALADRGHSVTVFSNMQPGEGGIADGVSYMPIGQVSQQARLGDVFERYARYTPNDLLIVQRVPFAFDAPFAAKVNLWWTHDLALQRTRHALGAQMWNVDGVLVVSEWHRQQVCKTYDLPEAMVHVIRNAINPSLFSTTVPIELRKRGKWMIYTSRPERGLGHLVEVGGIMERLAQKAPDISLKVAGYDNTTEEMRPLYERLWQRCRELPNVELLGQLGKAELAKHMQSAWAHVYPTTFEEVSCITAMEEQAAGTPVIASPVAALPETLNDGGVVWVPHTAEEAPHLEGFVDAILGLSADEPRWDTLHFKALEKSRAYRYADSAEEVEKLAESTLRERSKDTRRMFRHLVRHGDYFAAKRLDLPPPLKDRLDRDYAFARDDKSLRKHYAKIAEWEGQRNISHGQGMDEYILTPRIQALCNDLAMLKPGDVVLDFACGQGHHVEFLARKFPHLGFIGTDWSSESIAAANAFLQKYPLPNCRVVTEDEFGKEEWAGKFAAVNAGEILEHVRDPSALIDRLERYVKPGGWMFVSTPWGPWEDDGRVRRTGDIEGDFRAQTRFRAHLHHFEHEDLRELIGHKPEFYITVAPAGISQTDTPVGCFYMRWRVNENQPPCGVIDYARKLRTQSPRETLGVLMICRPDSETLGKTLSRIAPIADQIMIGMDGGAKAKRVSGPAWETAKAYGAEAFPIVSPLAQGFDSARNDVLGKMVTDWVLWIDDDEVMVWPERLPKYLRPSIYDAFAIQQHHYSAEPAGQIKTDMPCRLFRRDRGIRFFGVVHEHPERSVNGGCGRVCMMGDVSIMHNGYETEATRRARFTRNFPLMLRDRNLYPERQLGKMLWVRDLAHMIRFDMEIGKLDSKTAQSRSEEAIALWRDIVANGQLRMAIDALPYYSECVQVLHGPNAIHWAGSMGARKYNVGGLNGKPPDIVAGVFANSDDIRLLVAAMEKDTLSIMGERYF